MYLPVRISAALLHAADKVMGRGVWDAWRRLDESQWWDANRLAELQAERLAARVREVAMTSPLWRERLSGAGVDPSSIRKPADLERMPVLERADLQDRSADLTCQGLAPGEALPNSSGGSSGVNVQFFVDRACWRQRNAIELRQWSFLGLGPGAQVAIVWGSPMDESKARGWRKRLRRLVDNSRFFSAYRLGEQDADRILNWLSRHKPDVLVGYASVLDLLAQRALERGGIPAAKYVISSAEALYPDQRERIHRGLGAEVFNRYGCREVGLIAMECASHQGLHLMDERLIVEFEASPGQNSLTSRPAEMLITDLDNRATPFIRYRIGDMAVPGDPGPCPCGRGLSRVSAVSGRTFDIIRGPAGGAVAGTFWSLLLRTAVKGVRSFQVIQHEVARIEIRFTPPDGLSVEDKDVVTGEVRVALGTEVKVEFSGQEHLEPLPSGKHRFIVALRSTGGQNPAVRPERREGEP